jgi:mRNA-degrading endonuclease YafQ of YafQ-DinJ toxin-antitoxin module
MDFDTAIAKYVALRKECEDIERDAKKEVATRKEKMALLEAWITTKAQDEGLTKVATHKGTGYWSTHYSCSVANPEAFFEYVREHEAWDLLEKRASKTAVRATVEEIGEVPPGVNFSSYKVFNVREIKE